MFALERYVSLSVHRLLASSEHDEHGEHGDVDGHSEFGVHVTYEILYASIVFFTVIWVSGAFCSRVLRMPALVGQVVAGIVMGPPVLNFVPNPEAFVMLGEIGLILLVIEAGIDIDLTTLHLIGPRGVIIALIGSILPIAIGFGVALAIGTDVRGSIASGSAFGPTSLGIAMNILRTAKINNTPVGQLIVAAAVIDDMIALVILSQLRALAGEVTVAGLIVPIISALAFLILGGYLAVYVIPQRIDKYILNKISAEKRGVASIGLMFALLLLLMPATYYAQASPLMGAFLAGVTFCSNHDAHEVFVSQMKRVMQWLIRIFFAASIGFQVPVKHFGDSVVLGHGFLFTLSLLGKLAVGFLVPNFTQNKRFTGHHLRDCLVVGFSMAAEGEFAFVIAVFVVDEGLISQDLYASIVLAVLLSTIFAPFFLRLTINQYNKKTKQVIEDAQKLELERKTKLELGGSVGDLEQQLVEGIKDQTTVFLCIQTQSPSGWGLLPKIMQIMFELKLEVIDHRSWNPRGVNTTLVSEIYAKDSIECKENENVEDALKRRIDEVQERILGGMKMKDAKVRVSRWFPGIVAEIVEESTEPGQTQTTQKARLSVAESIMNEASKALDKTKERQTTLTREKTLKEIIQDTVPTASPSVPEAPVPEQLGGAQAVRQRRVRRKMRSTPVVGGDLFASPTGEVEVEEAPPAKWRSQTAQLHMNGKIYPVQVDSTAVQRIEDAQSAGTSVAAPTQLGSFDIRPAPTQLGASDIRPRRRVRQVSYDNMLQGFVRKDETQIQTIEEEEQEQEVKEVDV